MSKNKKKPIHKIATCTIKEDVIQAVQWVGLHSTYMTGKNTSNNSILYDNKKKPMSWSGIKKLSKKSRTLDQSSTN